jgi:hypothetical protein
MNTFSTDCGIQGKGEYQHSLYKLAQKIVLLPIEHGSLGSSGYGDGWKI